MIKVGDEVRYIGSSKWNGYITYGKGYTVKNAEQRSGFSRDFYVGEILDDRGYLTDIVSAELGELYRDFELVRGVTDAK